MDGLKIIVYGNAFKLCLKIRASGLLRSPVRGVVGYYLSCAK